MTTDTPETVTVDAGGTELVCLAAGHEGPLALCLHGFPDTAHGFRHLLPALAGAGYRAVAPFMRGYAPSPCRRTAATRPARSSATRSVSTRRSAAAATRSWSGTTGARWPPTARPRSPRTAGGGS